MTGFEQIKPPRVAELTGNPEQIIRDFTRFLKSIDPMYREVIRLREQAETELNDLNHYTELHPNLNARDGYKVYRLTAEKRRERRQYKAEEEMLSVLHGALSGELAKLPDQLAALQGRLRLKREQIESRTYVPRTDALDSFIGGDDDTQ